MQENRCTVQFAFASTMLNRCAVFPTSLRSSTVKPLLVLLIGLFVSTRTGATPPAPPSADPPPNIVLIVSDDQGYGDLGCYGSTTALTPHLDRLAAEGVRLTSFYVAWPACTPSRAALLTGRYPQRNGTYDMIRNDKVDFGYHYPLEEYAVSPENVLGTDVREVFISNLLEETHVSACFGKWDGGQLKRFLPLQRGFDEFYGFTNTGVDYFTHERYGIASMRRGNRRTTEDRGEYATDLFAREAERFLRANHDRPFFLYLPFNAPHVASNLDPKVRGWVQAPKRWLDKFPPGKNVRAEKRRHYLAAVACMDEAIGRVLGLLDEYEIADNTLVIFFSDNGGGGPADNGPLRGRKAQMFEGGVRVPAIVRWPRELPRGTTCDQFLTSLEIFPTIAAATRHALPSRIAYDGFDLLPVLKGKQPSPRREMFWKRRGDVAARVGKWKWVDSAKGSGLFDLEQDLGETTDLSGRHPEILKRLQTRFAAWMREMEASPPRGPFRDY